MKISMVINLVSLMQIGHTSHVTAVSWLPKRSDRRDGGGGRNFRALYTTCLCPCGVLLHRLVSASWDETIKLW